MAIDDSASARPWRDAHLTDREFTAATSGGFHLDVQFDAAALSQLLVQGGPGDASGGNLLYVDNTPNVPTAVRTGAGGDNVIVGGTTGTLEVDVARGGNSITLGQGTVQTIRNAVTLRQTGPAGAATLTIDDSAGTANHGNVVIGSGGITGLAPGAINFTASSVSMLTVNDGTGTSTYTITDTPVAASGGMILNTGLGGNTVNVEGTSAPLIVNTGSNDAINITSSSSTLDPIGSVTVNDASGTSTVTVDDSGFNGTEDYVVTNATAAIGRSSSFGLAYNGIGALTLNGSPGSDYFDIDSTSAATIVNAGSGGNIFHISPFTQYLAASIAGPLTLNGGGSDILEFFDANDPNSETFSFDPVPMSLTLGSTGQTIATFSGMGGGIYVLTNGFSTPDDQSGTVIFDPDGGPPSPQGNGPSAGSGSAPHVLAEDYQALVMGHMAAAPELGAGDVSHVAHALASALSERMVGQGLDPARRLDQLFGS